VTCRQIWAAIALGQVGANAGGERGASNDLGDMRVIEPVGTDAAVLPRDPPEHRAMGDPPQADRGSGSNGTDLRGL
jgi:hypothetical protein